MDIRNKTVVVTGGATGIGRALVLASRPRRARRGSWPTSTPTAPSRSPQPRPPRRRAEVFARRTDVADAAAVQALADEATRRFAGRRALLERRYHPAQGARRQRGGMAAHLGDQRDGPHPCGTRGAAADAGAWRRLFRQHRVGGRPVVADRPRRPMRSLSTPPSVLPSGCRSPTATAASAALISQGVQTKMLYGERASARLPAGWLGHAGACRRGHAGGHRRRALPRSCSPPRSTGVLPPQGPDYDRWLRACAACTIK